MELKNSLPATLMATALSDREGVCTPDQVRELLKLLSSRVLPSAAKVALDDLPSHSAEVFDLFREISMSDPAKIDLLGSIETEYLKQLLDYGLKSKQVL